MNDPKPSFPESVNMPLAAETTQGKSLLVVGLVSTLSFAALVAASYFKFVKPRLESRIATMAEVDSLTAVGPVSMDSIGIVYRDTPIPKRLEATPDTATGEQKPQLKMSDDFIRVVEMYEARIARLEEKNYLQQVKIDSLEKERLTRQAEIDSISNVLLRKLAAQVAPPAPATKVTVKQPTRTGMGARELAKIYDAMPAQQAAAVLSQLETETVAQILVLLRERQAAKILSAMDSQKAAEISRMIGR